MGGRYRNGYRVLWFRGGPLHRRNRSQILPLYGKWFYWACAHYWRLVRYTPGKGMWCVAVYPMGEGETVPIWYSPEPKGRTVKRRSPLAGPGAIVPPLPSHSKLLAKQTLLCEFLSATKYDDETPRQPGYLWLTNDTTGYTVHLFDPDSASRLLCRGGTIDEAFLLAETGLGLENAPWVPDRFLQARLEGSKKKK